jgi:hypothetical protein
MDDNKDLGISTPDFVEYIQSKGWDRASLITRWNLEGRGRIVRFEDVQLSSRSVFFNDALAGLPMRSEERGVISPARYIQIVTEKGWNQVSIAKRWGLSSRRINTIVNNSERALSFDDALVGLPENQSNAWLTPLQFAILDDKGWTLKEVLARWPLTERELKKFTERDSGIDMLSDWFQGLPNKK